MSFDPFYVYLATRIHHEAVRKKIHGVFVSQYDLASEEEVDRMMEEGIEAEILYDENGEPTVIDWKENDSLLEEVALLYAVCKGARSAAYFDSCSVIYLMDLEFLHTILTQAFYSHIKFVLPKEDSVPIVYNDITVDHELLDFITRADPFDERKFGRFLEYALPSTNSSPRDRIRRLLLKLPNETEIQLCMEYFSSKRITAKVEELYAKKIEKFERVFKEFGTIRHEDVKME